MSVEPIAAYLEPIRRTVTVARAPAEAFDLFTSRIGEWWPLALFSINQNRATTCVIEQRTGGDLYEVRDDGERCLWGKVLVWEPPHHFVVTWHPGYSAEEATEVEVRFTPRGAETLVELEHRGWAKLGERAREAREGYAEGWGIVLEQHYVPAAVEGRIP